MNPAQNPLKPRILVAPLDWGLGHATRCIPIIKQLLTGGCEVLLAGEGKVEALLRSEFPQLLFLPLKGYRVKYGAGKWSTLRALVGQVPRLLQSVRYEQEWLQKAVQEQRIDAVISDNRFGLYHSQVYTVFMTHQLLIKTFLGKYADRWVQRLNYGYINRFNECWVPDTEDGPSLAGALSHPRVKPAVPLQYVGPLTRFEANGADVLQHYLLVLLSGPEPQRTLLENKILQQLKGFQKPVLLVRGLPGNVGLPPVPYHVTIANHLSTNALQTAIEGAEYVMARTGYSTVMDLLPLHKKCILIPTPGQNEQQYIARHLMQQNLALCVPQQKFVMSSALELAGAFPYAQPSFEKSDALQVAVQELIRRVSEKLGGME